MALEKYQSEFTAEDFENAIRAVPNIGDNGNWFIGDTDTGVFAGGVKVEGAEVGQTIVVKAVDENGKPTEWEPADLPSGGDVWRKIATVSFTEASSGIIISTDDAGNSFSCRKLYLFGCLCHDADNSVKSFDVFVNDTQVGKQLEHSYDTPRMHGVKMIIDASEPYINLYVSSLRNNWNAVPKAVNGLAFWDGRRERKNIEKFCIQMVDAKYPFNSDTFFELWGVDA